MDYLRDCAVPRLRELFKSSEPTSLYFGIANNWFDANNGRCKTEGITLENLETTKEV